jgi:ribosomal protein L11 methyltransferase
MSSSPQAITWHAQFTISEGLVAPFNEFINWPYELFSEPTLSCFEIEGTKNWLVEIFTDFNPNQSQIELMSNHLCKISNHSLPEITFTALEEKNWVKESQNQQTPINAGRFLCFASHHEVNLSQGENTIAILMDAGQAFGTGDHETTLGCLKAIDQLADEISPTNILDMGTGTGLLAIAAYKTWPVPTLATDNDPIAIDVSRENLEKNNIGECDFGHSEGIALLISEGFEHNHFKSKPKFDLIIANILANPLIELASDMKANLAENGVIILSGILTSQASSVIKAYEQQSLALKDQIDDNNWSILIFY